jgi:WD40 repeat protein
VKKNIPFQIESSDTDSSTWHLPDGAIARFGKGNITDMVLSPLVCTPFQLYDVSERKTVDQFSSDDGFDFLAFSPDPLRIWCHFPAFEYRTIDLWDFQADKEVLSLPQPKWWQEKDINAFALSVCGRYLACSPYTWTDEESVCVWDIRNRNAPIATFKLTERLGCLAFSPDNTLLAGACSTGTILLWDLKPFINRNKK